MVNFDEREKDYVIFRKLTISKIRRIFEDYKQVS